MLLAHHLDISTVCVPDGFRARVPMSDELIQGRSEWARQCGASYWVASGGVWPHTDDDTDKYFLVLTVVAGHHAILDAKCSSKELSDPCDTGVGSLHVIDPRVLHWLKPMSLPRRKWIALSWDVPRRRAKATARQIVKQFNGTWVSTVQLDRRYVRWHPDADGVRQSEGMETWNKVMQG